MSRKINFLLLYFAVAWQVALFAESVPQEQDFVIPQDNNFTAKFGAVEPGDVLIVNVTAAPGCKILESEVKGGDPTWIGVGTTFTGTVPGSWAGKHQGRFGGTYSCGEGGGGSPPPWSGAAVAKVLTLDHLTQIRIPEDRRRLKLGVCEAVKIEASESVSWSTSHGTLSKPIGKVTIFTAQNVAGTATITATCPDGATASLTFTILIPEQIEITPGAPFYHIQGVPSSGFTGREIVLTPGDVSFHAIQIREGTGTAIAHGVFADSDKREHEAGRPVTVRAGKCGES